MRSSWYKDPLLAFFAVGFVMFVIAGGIGGESAAIALMLSSCVEAAGCPTQCEGEGSTGSAEGSTGG